MSFVIQDSYGEYHEYETRRDAIAAQQANEASDGFERFIGRGRDEGFRDMAEDVMEAEPEDNFDQ